MGFDTVKFLTDNNIEHTHTHKHSTRGWESLRECPFCHSINYHFAMNKIDGHGSCWKCGPHSLSDTIVSLLNCSYMEALKIKKLYGGSIQYRELPKRTEIKEILPCKLPIGTGDLMLGHKKYLENRGFSHENLTITYNIKGIGMVPGSDWNWRIIIPITFNNIMVSFQGRDITGNENRERYKTAEKHEETYFHKHCLYGLDNIHDRKSVIVLEGVTKVWRLGRGAVATFGTSWTKRQATMLLPFENVFILFDKGVQAQLRADELQFFLSANVKNVKVIELDDIDDPGDMSQEDADNLMKELGIRR